VIERPDQPASELLATLQAVLNQVAEPSQVLQTILGQAVSRSAADRGMFVEVTRSGQLAFRVLHRFQRRDVTGKGHYSSGIFSEVLAGGRAVRLANALDDPRFMENASIQDFRLVSILCLPIRVDGEIAALVHLESNEPGHFTPDHERLLGSLLEVAAPAVGALRASEGMLREREELRQAESRAREELAESRELLARDWSFGRYIGRSAAVRQLGAQVSRAAATDFPVLMLGETGTGKSILARVLHHSSPRARQAIVTVFCPSLEKGMVEAELFGHKRGAFTGAVSDRIGKVQAADKGTLFLDEIGELPPDIQPKLLRLLQERTYERVGDPTERQADVRVIAATHRDLEQEVGAGRFRRDLYERLNYLPIRIPPLRERVEDIPLLLRHCLDQHEAGRWVELSAEAERYLVELDDAWPGNVRALEQLAVRLALEGPRAPVTPQDLRRHLAPRAVAAEAPNGAPGRSLEAGLPSLVAQEERKWIEEAIRRYPELSRSELALKLKISESALYKKLRLYGITK
jgi:transcriptional regulator with GAF, ATPase, and Fis domain